MNEEEEEVKSMKSHPEEKPFKRARAEGVFVGRDKKSRMRKT